MIPSWLTNTLTPSSICEGGEVTFSASVENGLGGTITWIRSETSGGTGTTVNSPHTENTAGTFYYRPHFAPEGDGCDLADGTETEVTVVLDPTISNPVGSTICSGTAYTFPAVTLLHGVSPTIQWEESDDNGVSDTWGKCCWRHWCYNNHLHNADIN